MKTIGDEVLLAVEDPLHAVETAQDLVRRTGSEDLPALRIGLDHGTTIWLGGDLFGPPSIEQPGS